MTRPSRWLIAVLVVSTVSLSTLACSKKTEEPAEPDFKPVSGPPLPPGPDKLQIVDEKVGTGQEAKEGDKVKVNYRGTLMNDKEFDSSYGKEPFEFTLGEGNVIKGWDQGVPGMKVGGKRKLTIPWPLAYGEAGSGDSIPPKAALKFDIELLEIEGAPPAPSAPASATPPKKK
jgi:FKBP-type peptidyl-prolyl cis-trans isomerase FkpA